MRKTFVRLYDEALRQMEQRGFASLEGSLVAARKQLQISIGNRERASVNVLHLFDGAHFRNDCTPEHKMLMLGFAAAIERSGGL
jgi:hypothetical protein